MKTRAITGILLASAAIMPIQAYAASGDAAPADASSTQAADQASTLGDIVVTARKTEEKLQDVPVTVTALGGAALQQQTVHSITDVQFHVPGFVQYPEAQGGAPDFAIRGTKQQGVSGSQGGVAVYLDYVPITSNFAIANSTYDLQSVQVLKGPQGTLFGKNTTGGAIIFAPNKPTDKFEGSITGEYGNYNRVDITAMLNTPIAPGVDFRIAGRYVHRDGYINNISGPDQDNENNHSFRASLRLQPSDAITNDTVFDYYHQDQHPNSPVFAGVYNAGTICGVYPGDCVNGVSRSATAAAALPKRTVDYGGEPNVNRGTYYGISNTTTFVVSDSFTVRNIFGYRHDKLDSQEENDGFSLPILQGVNHNRQRQYTNELDLIGNLFDDRLSYTVGFYYADNLYKQDSRYRIFAPNAEGGLPEFPIVVEGTTVFSPIAPSQQFNDFGVRSKAVFGQLNYKVDDRLTVTVGARYNQDKARFTSRQYQGYTDATETEDRCNIAAYASPDEILPGCMVKRRKTFNALTWNASLNYKPDPRTLIYISAGRGFQAGGFNQQIREPQYRTFGPEKVFNIEAGLKKDWQLADRPIRTNITIFRAQYRNQQRVENGQYSDGLNYIATFNVADSTIWGTEVEISYLPTPRLELSAAYSYVNAKYDHFITPSVEGIQQTDLSGAAITATPKHTINGTAAYSAPVGGGDGKLRFSLSGYYRTGVYFDDIVQTQYNHQKGYALFNGRIDLVKTLPVDIGVWMNNIANKTYGLFKFDQLRGLGYTSIFYGAPRTYGIDVTVRF